MRSFFKDGDFEAFAQLCTPTAHPVNLIRHYRAEVGGGFSDFRGAGQSALPRSR
jgi:hypothetical protein